MRTAVLSIGENKGAPRIWIEGRYLDDAGFTCGSNIKVEYGEGTVTVSVDPKGDRVVSKTRKAGGYPVVDLNNKAIAKAFATAKKVEINCQNQKIVITPAKSERMRVDRNLRRMSGSRKMGGCFVGGGLLDEAARQAGFEPAFAIEKHPDYADIYQANHGGHMLEGCISEVDFSRLPKVDLLCLGIPCEPFSQVRRQAGNVKRDKAELPEAHELSDMSLWGAMVIHQTNPFTVVMEEVPGYLESGIGLVMLNFLQRMYPNVETRIIDGTEYGAVTTRKRAVVIASEGKIRWPKSTDVKRHVRDILLDPNDERCEWFNRKTKSWLFEHWDTHNERGNGFESQKITPNTPSIQAITKRYFAGQGGNPVVKDVRPGREGYYRWLTVDEVKDIMGLPEDYYLGETTTIAGEIMGQGVLVNVFRQIIESVMPLSKRQAA